MPHYIKPGVQLEGIPDNPRIGKPFDPANIASRAPEVIRKPLAGLLSLYKDLLVREPSTEPQQYTPDPVGPMGAVAYGASRRAIPYLRAQGRRILDEVKQQGLEPRSLGISPNAGLQLMGKDPVPNMSLTPELTEALEVAQHRWPRVFGHHTDIADVDSLVKMKHLPKRVFGVSGRASEPKLSRLGFNAQNLTLGQAARDANPTFTDLGDNIAANTVGHELLHSADRIARPDFDEQYNAAQQLTGGYNFNSNEIRARNMGTRMEHIVQAIRDDMAARNKYNPLGTAAPNYRLRVPHTEQTRGVSTRDVDLYGEDAIRRLRPLSETRPEFAPVGGEDAVNALRPRTKPVDALERAYEDLRRKGGR